MNLTVLCIVCEPAKYPTNLVKIKSAEDLLYKHYSSGQLLARKRQA
jgi:hypothetical protein